MWKRFKDIPAALTKRPLRCSFCGRKAAEVERLVGGVSAYICDACISECVSVLQHNGGFEPPRPGRAHETRTR